MPKPAYQFVDNIRCIAMLAIVTEHTSFLGSYAYSKSSSVYWEYLASIQLVKFGTIAFFIIAGFLFNENSGNYAFGEYLRRRFDNIFKPWLLWSLTFFALLTFGAAFSGLVQGVSLKLIASGIWWGLKTVYLHSNYWFIMNFFFCMTVLLLSKKSLHSWKLGAILFALTCFYSANVHAEWIMPHHTTAIFGFVFFYWLGVQLNMHFKTIQKLIKSIPFFWFAFATGITLAISVYEASFLSDLNKVDPINTLRFSNIAYSISAFLLLLKVNKFNWLSFLQPRKTTYGIFLVHYILVFLFLPLVMGELSQANVEQFSLLEMYKYQFTRFFIVYAISFVSVSILVRTRYSWIVGAAVPKKRVLMPYSKTNEQTITVLETEAA